MEYGRKNVVDASENNQSEPFISEYEKCMRKYHKDMFGFIEENRENFLVLIKNIREICFNDKGGNPQSTTYKPDDLKLLSDTEIDKFLSKSPPTQNNDLMVNAALNSEKTGMQV